MSKSIQAIRGMNDILPAQTVVWRWIEDQFRILMEKYGYQEIRLPIVEMTELFKRSIGEVTDIVEKEMYTFSDRNGDSLTLRPEGTAGCVRAAIENSLLHNQQQKFWYGGAMFRHERPQKGRYRQFHQLGVETFGMAGPDIDVEIILLTDRLWKALGIRQAVSLELNSLGSPQARADYRAMLVQYLSAHDDQLDDESKRRLHTNPLRILDSKNPDLHSLIEAAPKLMEYLDDESRQHFDRCRKLLDDNKIPYRVNPRLVRGLDYYNRTVFEWVTERLGTQGTICAGGRYDGLVAQLGGNPIPAVGFALGMERVVALLEELNVKPDTKLPDVYCIMAGEEAESQGIVLVEQLRDCHPSLCVYTNAGGGSFKSQMKRADKSGAQLALILGDDECKNGTVSIKFLRSERTQETVTRTALSDWLNNYFQN